MKNIRVLIDRCAHREGVTHRSVSADQKLRWGDLTIDVPVLQRTRFPPRPDEKFKIEQLPYLASIAVLAKFNRLELCTSFELDIEQIRNREPDRGYVGFDMFEGISLVSLSSPVSRSISIAAFGRSSGIKENEQEEFLRQLTDARFAYMRRLFGDKHVADAFHLWTAEVHRLDYFLTTDKKFLNVYSDVRGKLASPTRATSPKGLCESLGVGPTDIEELARQRPAFS